MALGREKGEAIWGSVSRTVKSDCPLMSQSFQHPASSLHVCRLNSRRKVSCVLWAPTGLYSEKDLQQRRGGVGVGGGRGNPLAWQSRGQRRLASR